MFIIVSESGASWSILTLKAVLDVVLHLNLDVYACVSLMSTLPLLFQALGAHLQFDFAHHLVEVEAGPLVHSDLILEKFPINRIVTCL